MAKATSSRTTTSATSKRKPSVPPAPITQVIEKPSAAPTAKTGTSASTTAPSHDAIAQRAYELYQSRPHHEGSPENDWFRAERDLAG